MCCEKCGCKSPRTFTVNSILNSPPDNRIAGQSFICGSGPTGEWNGMANFIATWGGGECANGWCFTEPCNGDTGIVAHNSTGEGDQPLLQFYKYYQGWSLIVSAAIS